MSSRSAHTKKHVTYLAINDAQINAGIDTQAIIALCKHVVTRTRC